jgi:hypothetical protein
VKVAVCLILTLTAGNFSNLPGYVIEKLGRLGSARITAMDSMHDLYDLEVTGSDGSIHRVTFDRHHTDTNWPSLRVYFGMSDLELQDQFDIRYLGLAPNHFVLVFDRNGPWARRKMW